jgi:hypothetical protein
MVTSNYFSLIVLTTCHFLALDKKALAILAIVENTFKNLELYSGPSSLWS